MAEKVGEIFFDVTLETGQMIDGSRKVQRETALLERAFTQVAAAVASFAAALAIGNVIRESVNAARAYEKTLADLSAITGVTGEALGRLSDSAKDLARNSTASSGQVVEAMKLIASAKPELLETAGALTAVTKEAIALAEASGMQLPAAAEAVTLALNQFGEGADQAARFVNVLAAGAKFGASEIADTAIALKNSAVSAASAKVSFEETNAALQALAAGGIKGGEAGTSLRNVILKLENDTDKRLKPSIVGLAGALQALDARNLSSAALTKMFGLENVNAAQALIGSASAIKTLTGQLTGTNTAYEQAAIQANTFDASVRRMNGALEMAGQAIGNQFLPFLRQGADAVQSLANSLSTGAEIMSKAMTVVEVGSALLAGMLAVRLVSAVQAVIASYTASAVAANAANAATLMLTGTTAALTAGQTSLAVATGVASTAGRAFGAVMAGLGGPIGLAVAALVTIAWNWDVITGKANDAANTSEKAAARIAAALKKSGEQGTKDLRAQLAEAQSSIAAIDKEMSMPRQLQSGRGMGGGRPLSDQRIADLKEKRDALVKISGDIEKAMFKVAASDEGGGMVGPADTSPKKPLRGLVSEGAGDTKFDAAGYLAGLEKATLEGVQRIDAIEREALRKNQALLAEGKISRQTAAQAVNLIEAEAAQQRQDIALSEAETRRSIIQKMGEDEAAAAKLRGEQQAKDLAMAREIQLADDPIGRLQLELQTKSALLTEAAERDRANEELYAAARVSLEEQTASAIAGIHANTLAGYSSNLAAAAGMVEKFGGKQNALYKGLFAASKAFAIAESIIKIQQGIAGAAALPFPANIPAIGAVIAATSGIISTISGTNYGGGRLTGGPVSAGSTYRVNESGAPEMFVGANGRQYAMPTQAGTVVPADAGGGRAPTIIIQNTGTPQRVESQSYDSGSNTATLVMADLVDQISNNSGPVWSALTGSSNVQGRL